MLKFMLDTNIAIHVIKERPREVLRAFNVHAGQMCISTIAAAELYHGAEKSTTSSENLSIVEDFLSRLQILPYSLKSAAHYGDIRADLERSGELIGVNDLHIAAHARSNGLILVTNNLREFNRVPGLRLENWL